MGIVVTLSLTNSCSTDLELVNLHLGRDGSALVGSKVDNLSYSSLAIIGFIFVNDQRVVDLIQ